MGDDQVPVYVRLAAESAQRLERAVTTSGRSKRALIESALRAHIADDGLIVGRASLREDTPAILTLDEAADLLRLGADGLLTAAEAGKVPGRKIGEEWRFSREALLAWLKAE